VEDTSHLVSELHSLSVEALVIGLQQSSQETSSAYCGELILRFEPLLRGAWRKTTPFTEYEDFVQEAFYQLFKNLPHLKDPKAFPGFFQRIVLSVAVNHIRKNSNKHTTSLEEIEDVVVRLDEELHTKVLVRTYLEHLAPKQRQVIELEFFHDLSLEEIAKKLGLKASTVRATKFRALKKLRKLILADEKKLKKSLTP